MYGYYWDSNELHSWCSVLCLTSCRYCIAFEMMLLVSSLICCLNLQTATASVERTFSIVYRISGAETGFTQIVKHDSVLYKDAQNMPCRFVSRIIWYSVRSKIKQTVCWWPSPKRLLMNPTPDDQWLKWSCEAGGGSPDEARLEQTPYPFPTQLIWRYLGIK